MNNNEIKKELVKMVSNQDITALKKAVINDILDQEDPKNYINDVLNMGCQSGIVTGLIYYTDTDAFAKKHIEDILDLYQEACETSCNHLNIIDNKLNWLAWFGYEMIIQELALELEL